MTAPRTNLLHELREYKSKIDAIKDYTIQAKVITVYGYVEDELKKQLALNKRGDKQLQWLFMRGLKETIQFAAEPTSINSELYQHLIDIFKHDGSKQIQKSAGGVLAAHGAVLAIMGCALNSDPGSKDAQTVVPLLWLIGGLTFFSGLGVTYNAYRFSALKPLAEYMLAVKQIVENPEEVIRPTIVFVKNGRGVH